MYTVNVCDTIMSFSLEKLLMYVYNGIKTFDGGLIICVVFVL